jgi:hypothetical protein
MEGRIAVITTDTRSSAKKILVGSYAMDHRDACCARLIRKRFSREWDDPYKIHRLILHPFGGAKFCLLRWSKKALLRVNPERSAGL